MNKIKKLKLSVNKKNYEAYLNNFQGEMNFQDEDNVCKIDENGNISKAIPLNYDYDQCKYDAIKDLIETAIKEKRYKTWKIGTKLVDTYSKKHERIKLYDVIYLFTESWEIPVFPVLVQGVYETKLDDGTFKTMVNVTYIDNEEDDVVVKDIDISD